MGSVSYTMDTKEFGLTVVGTSLLRFCVHCTFFFCLHYIFLRESLKYMHVALMSISVVLICCIAFEILNYEF